MRKAKALCAIVLSLVVFVTTAPPVVAEAADGTTIVYITKTGEKYHTGKCSYLRKSKIEISLEDAVDGGYEPCSRCEPPELD